MNLICGLWRRGGAAEGLADMLRALPPAPDAADREWTDGTVALGCRHRRGPARPAAPPLAETERGLAAGDAQRGLAAVASARLDDRGELREALGLPRAAEAELSDGELILRAWRRWGRACPEHLLGDFAFAVWDARREALFCARDHIGAKPFYYAAVPGGFAFASEVGAVLAAPGVDSRFDEATLSIWLAPAPHLDYRFDGRTFYRPVRKLLPGHALTVDRGGARVERWWRPEEAPAAGASRRGRSDGECAEAFLALYARAVRDCLRGPGPIGAHLSGGLDSSGIAVLAARELRRQGRPPPRLFSWHPPPGGRGGAREYRLIDSVSRQEGIAPIWCPPSGRDAVAFLRRDVTLGQKTMAAMPEAAVQRRAEELGVGAILSGWGGDDAASFNGRGFYEQLLLSGRLLRLWREVGARSRHPLAHILAYVALRLVHPRAARFAKEFRRAGRWPRLSPEPAMRYTGVRATQLALLLRGHIGQRAEGWAEAGWRRGVEYRYPLLDRRLLRFALGLPADMYRRGPWSRWIVRHALRSVLPDEVLWNRKKEEPVCGEARHRAILEAVPEIRRMLRSRSAPPGRSRYLDLDRLMEALDRAGSARAPVPVRRLRFLDF